MLLSGVLCVTTSNKHARNSAGAIAFDPKLIRVSAGKLDALSSYEGAMAHTDAHQTIGASADVDVFVFVLSEAPGTAVSHKHSDHR